MSEKYLNDLENLAKRVSLMPPHLQERNKIQDQACYLLCTSLQRGIEIKIGQVWKSEDNNLYRTVRFDELGIWQMLGVNNKGASSELPNYMRLYWTLQSQAEEKS